MSKASFAPGKMILSGEYAVVFGYPGIAVPTTFGVEVTWKDTGDAPMKIVLGGLTGDEWYRQKILDLCIQISTGVRPAPPTTGTLTIHNQIPVGRGMGSSTALVIAICKCLLGKENRTQAVLVEDTINPGNSGLDFSVIWINRPVKFTKGSTPEPLHLNLDFLKNSTLIDTGKPGETTADLVAWIKTRAEEPETAAALKTIGRCTERLIAGDDIKTVMRDHHQAKMKLGVVTTEAVKIIADIERKGGAAKVLGAGARTGGGGMVLALQ